MSGIAPFWCCCKPVVNPRRVYVFRSPRYGGRLATLAWWANQLATAYPSLVQYGELASLYYIYTERVQTLLVGDFGVRGPLSQSECNYILNWLRGQGDRRLVLQMHYTDEPTSNERGSLNTTLIRLGLSSRVPGYDDVAPYGLPYLVNWPPVLDWTPSGEWRWDTNTGALQPFRAQPTPPPPSIGTYVNVTMSRMTRGIMRDGVRYGQVVWHHADLEWTNGVAVPIIATEHFGTATQGDVVIVAADIPTDSGTRQQLFGGTDSLNSYMGLLYYNIFCASNSANYNS